jgi:hypothetical protein
MFNSFLDSNNKLLVNRLGRAQAKILGLSLSTKEEYLAQVTSIINAVINIGYGMQPLVKIAASTPAVVGDCTSNLETLNEDAADIADEISRLEDNASVLFNLAAACRNSIGQQIREAIYASTATHFVEEFVDQTQLDSSTSAEIDMNAGIAQLPLSNETVLAPSFAVGENSVGSASADISLLATGGAETLFVWNGTLLEVIVSFAAPTIVNRMTIQPDTYLGYEITTLTASPDGSVFSDILADLNVPAISLDASAGKYAGVTVIDFAPRSVSKIRMILQNLVAGDTLGIRSLGFTQRSYQPTGMIVSKPQTSPAGSVLFSVDQDVFSPFVSVTHQISGDSVHYTTVQPGEIVLPSTWWYRALLNRSSQAFTTGSSPVSPTTADPNYSTGFTLVKSSSIPLSPTTIERTLVFSNVTGSIPLAETPLPGTLQLSQGSMYLTSSQYSFNSSNELSFPSTMTTVTVTYQTSAAGAQSLQALENYYTPLLTSVHFESQ